MTRLHWLLVSIVSLTIANGAYQWWRHRGLVTIHCEDWSPAKVVHEIERQSGAVVRTNLPEDLKLRIQVDKVPLGEALETLTTVAEARWRLAYVFAPKLPDAHTAVASMVAGTRPEGWKQVHVPLFGFGDDDGGVVQDPRKDVWTVKAPEKADFQSYAQEAAQNVNAAFTFPEGWNPAVNHPPSSGPIADAAPALAKAAGGRVLEVFLVEKRNREFGRGGPPDRGPGRDEVETPGGGRRDGEGRRDRQFSGEDREKMRAIFEQRALAEIAKLPADKRAAAQAEFEERRKFYESLRDLTPEERRAKMEERMNDPGAQQRMDNRMDSQNARMSPDQRVQRAKGYVERKTAARTPQ